MITFHVSCSTFFVVIYFVFFFRVFSAIIRLPCQRFVCCLFNIYCASLTVHSQVLLCLLGSFTLLFFLLCVYSQLLTASMMCIFLLLVPSVHLFPGFIMLPEQFSHYLLFYTCLCLLFAYMCVFVSLTLGRFHKA